MPLASLILQMNAPSVPMLLDDGGVFILPFTASLAVELSEREDIPMNTVTLYSETEQKVRLVGLKDTTGTAVDNADVRLTLLDRTLTALTGFNSISMTSEGSGGNYSYLIPANAALTPGQFGCQFVIKVYLASVLKMSKYRPLNIEQGDN